MLLLILGKGKTGSIVAQVARERGHSVRVLDRENFGASALTGAVTGAIAVRPSAIPAIGATADTGAVAVRPSAIPAMGAKALRPL